MYVCLRGEGLGVRPLSLVEVVAAPLVVRHCHVRVLLHSILEILEGRRGRHEGTGGQGGGRGRRYKRVEGESMNEEGGVDDWEGERHERTPVLDYWGMKQCVGWVGK